MHKAIYFPPAVGLVAWAVAAGVPGLTPTAAAPHPDRPPPARPYAADPHAFKAAANTSCAAAACHGGGAVGRVGSEQSTWADQGREGVTAHDPHRKAYGVLFEERSTRMIDLLNGSRSDGHKLAPAHQEALCLKCHAVDRKKWYDGEELPDNLRAEGVACEACHGTSEKWLTEHYLPGWKGLSNRVKAEKYGFTPTKNLVSRAANCATCHVGAAGGQEVNHDLIAAGHPRLNFEYTRFHHAPDYRKHWAEPTPRADFELRAWYVGQLTSLRAAVGLLEERAAKADAHDATTPWPEFSESSCFACHQPIGTSEVRRPRGFAGRKTGTLPWQPWYTAAAAILPAVHETLLPGTVPPNLKAFIDLRKEMEERQPSAARVKQMASDAGAALDAALNTVQAADDAGAFAHVPPDAAAALGRRLVADTLVRDDAGLFAAGGGMAAAATFDRADTLTSQNAVLKDYDWDFVAQHYLGIAAAYYAAGGGAADSPVVGWKGPLDGLRAALAFPTDPRTPDVRFDSPGAYRPANARRHLMALDQTLRSEGGPR